MAKGTTITLSIIGVLIAVVLVLGFTGNLGIGSVTGNEITVKTEFYSQEELATQDFSSTIELKDKYDGTAIASATVYVYEEKPSTWLDYQATFSDDNPIETETSNSDGEITLNKNPATYYLIVEKTGYNTQFVEYDYLVNENAPEIRVGDLSTYTAPTESVKVSSVGTLTADNFNLAITANSSSFTDEVDRTYIEVSDNAEVLIASLIFTPNEALTNDTDSDGLSDIGVDNIKLQLNSKTWTIDVDELSAGDTEKYEFYDFNDGLLTPFSLEDEASTEFKATVSAKTNTIATTERLSESQAIGTIQVKDVFGDSKKTVTLTS